MFFALTRCWLSCLRNACKNITLGVNKQILNVRLLQHHRHHHHHHHNHHGCLSRTAIPTRQSSWLAMQNSSSVLLPVPRSLLRLSTKVALGRPASIRPTCKCCVELQHHHIVVPMCRLLNNTLLQHTSFLGRLNGSISSSPATLYQAKPGVK